MHITLTQPRQRTLFTIAVLLLFSLFGGAAGLTIAQASSPEPVTEDPHAALFQDPEDGSEEEQCGACHEEAVEAWQGSAHDLAFEAGYFQEAWESVDMEGSCLDCHTTEYSPATGEFDYEGVSCAACHGQIPEGHPAEGVVDLQVAFNSCAECHPQTHDEFRETLHDVAGLDCISCHYPHDNGLKLEDDTAQCLNCHGSDLDGFHHVSHVEAGLSCRDCHGWIDPDQEVPITGLAYTGHDFISELPACIDCHDDLDLELVADNREEPMDDTLTEEAILEGQEAIVRVQQLETAVETLILQQRNQTAINVLLGALGGLVVGGIVAAIIVRAPEPAVIEEDIDEEEEEGHA